MPNVDRLQDRLCNVQDGPLSRRRLHICAEPEILCRSSHRVSTSDRSERNFLVCGASNVCSSRCVTQAYRPIFLARQTTANDIGAQSGQRARRRGRELEDDDETDRRQMANGDM